MSENIAKSFSGGGGYFLTHTIVLFAFATSTAIFQVIVTYSLTSLFSDNVTPIIQASTSSRDRPKFGFGFGYGAETGDIYSFG